MDSSIVPTRLDLKADLKYLYTAPVREAVTVEVPRMQFLMLDGKGDPNTAQEYKDGVEALYSVGYTAKFLFKKEAAIDYPVMPLEGLWWADGGRDAPRENWRWTIMIMQPECVTEVWFAEACKQARRKKNPRALEKVRLEYYAEGASIQIMHIGPFADEGPTLAKLDRFMQEHGYGFRGKHHEIYLNDLRRVAPEKMRTVIRHPLVVSAKS